MDDIGEFLVATFPNYTEEMWLGNQPCGKGHKRVNGDINDRWETKYGGGESYNGVIETASFSLNHKITIYISYNHLWIIDIRHSGKFDFWEYVNNGTGMPGGACCNEGSRHQLEPEKIELILGTKIPNCKFWNMVRERAVELYVNNK